MKPEAAADPKTQARPRRGRVRRALLGLFGAAGLAAGLYGVAAYYGGPWLIDRWLAQFRDAPAGRTATRDSVRFNPFTLVAQIDGIGLRDAANGSGFAAERIVVNFAGASLREWRPMVSSVVVEGARIELGEAADVAALMRAAPIPGLGSVQIGHLSAGNGHLMIGPYEVSAFALSIVGFDATSGVAGRFELNADLASGTGLAASGRVTTDLASIEGQLAVEAVDLATAAPLLGGTPARIDPNGRADLSAAFLLASPLGDPSLSLTNAEIEFSALTLSPSANLTVAADRIAATGDLTLARGTDASGRLTIDDAAFDVTDTGVQPPQRLTLTDATVLVTADNANAGLLLGLEGALSGAGDAGVTIRKPAGGASGATVSLEANRLPSGTLSAYAVDAVGHGLVAGESDLALEYFIDGNRTDGTLRIVSRGLAFDAAASAPPAESSRPPIELASALLEDANGVIELDLPFAGNTGSVRDAVAGALQARIANVTTTPFDALAPVIGDATASAVPFQPGDAALTDGALATIARLTDALKARPRLGVRVHGGFEPTVDSRALAREQIELHVQLATAGAALPGAESAPVDLGSAHTRDVLDEFAGERLPEAYLSELRNDYDCEAALAEICQRAYYELVFDALVANEEISETTLTRLGRFRALSVADALTQNGIAEERIAISNSGDMVETAFGFGLPVELIVPDASATVP